jgi:hypothetical protein
MVTGMSLPMVMRFSLTNDDMLTAYNAQQDSICSPAARYIVVAVGCVFTFGPAIDYLCHTHARFGIIDTILLIIGLILLRAWLVVPFLRRSRIRRESGAAKTIRIIIDENSITEEAGDVPKETWEWNHVDRIVESRKGLIIYFHEGRLMWLPTRIFDGNNAREEFIALAARKDKL